MKNLKKLSLEDEINREAEEIEKKVKENKEIEGMTVSEDMETALFNKIQEYEYDKRLKKVVYRKKKRTYVIRGDCCNYHFDLWQCYDQCRK